MTNNYHRPKHVLLVEDNPGDARLLQELLKEVNPSEFELTTVDTLGAALEMPDKNRFDVILLDLSLPDASGLETVNKMHLRAKDLPIVVLTGMQDEELAIKAVQAGAQDYLVKGQVDGNLMVRAIRYAVERKKAESEQNLALTKAADSERLVTVGTLASGLAHELNQPLQIFKFSINTLKKMSRNGKWDEEMLNKKLGKMDQLTDYMASIITNLLGFVRPDTEHTDYLLIDILKSVRSMIGKQLTSENIRLELDVPDDFIIHCNKNTIMEVFMNLFFNARDAYFELPDERASNIEKLISVSTMRNDHTLRVYVKDQACGIPASIQNHVFDPFFSTKPSMKGTGMGLHIVRQIMKDHKGDISFKVEDGLSTTFELVFPALPDYSELEMKT